MQNVERDRSFGRAADVSGFESRVVLLEGYLLNVPLEPIREDPVYATIKRLADIVVASLAILVLSPVMFITAVLIWLNDRGPIIYFQTRVGRCGEGFRFYKFRSMHLHADKVRAALEKQNEAQGAHFKIKGDPRITGVGKWIRKFSIDELPQLFSVLTGKMSIVGPRPHLPGEVEAYVPQQELRLLVKPGLLCLREIRGRSELSFDEWVQSDIEYVRRRSLWLDFTIFVRAFPAVLSARGAY